VIGETFRRHLTSLGFLTFAGFVCIVSLGFSQFNRPASAWPTLIFILALIAGTGPIGPEFSAGTLQLILVKPINRAVYLLSRVAGVVLSVWTVAIVAAACELAGRALEDADLIFFALVNSMAEVVLVVALLTLFASVVRAYYSVAVYLVLLVFCAAIPAMLQKRLPEFVLDAIKAVDNNLFPSRPARFEPEFLLLIACNAAIALLLACLAFRRREVPYGAE
jgi:ABC-type transport system involved in multi-copper enzyme maturation permease subunit